jgi:hypothetical protein
MNAAENEMPGKPPLVNYWRLWLVNAVLVSAGLLFFLAAQYGTYEFFGVACLMALLPFIPALVLIGGGGSTVFILTRVRIEKRSLPAAAARALLLGPGLIVFLLLVLLAAGQSPARRLAYICHGHAPKSPSHVRVAGYSTFLNEEWLAVFNVGPTEFQTLVAQAELAPADAFEFKSVIEQSSLKNTGLLRSFPSPGELLCYQRVFKPGEEHERGRMYAVFDRAASTAAVFREYHD